MTRLPALAWLADRFSLLHRRLLCSICARRVNTWHGAQSMRAQGVEWLERCSLDRRCQLCAVKGRFDSASVCRTVRAELPCKGLFPGLVGEVPGSSSRLREIQRLERCGSQGAKAAPHAAWEAGGAPTRTVKEECHARQVLAHTRWRRRATFSSAGGAGSTPHTV